MNSISPKISVKSRILFLSFLAILFFAYRYPNSIVKGPCSMHMWRQADCLSITKNYLEDGFHFFKPSIHWTTIDNKDRAVSEFPIMYYFAALIWYVFGQHEFIFRLINMSIVFIGLFYLFKLSYEILSDNFWSYYIPLFLFTSPTLVYYSNNFLMNAPSFGLVLIGLYYYWRFEKSSKSKFLYFSMLIFLFAGLLKVTSLLLLTAIFFVHLASQFKIIRKKLDLPKFGKLIHIVPMLIVYFIVFAWIYWAKDYNKQNISGIFLQRPLPIWDTDNLYDGLNYGTQNYISQIPAYFNRTAIFIIITLFIWLILRFRKTHIYHTILTTMCFLGALGFILLFFKALPGHDYHLTNLLIIIPLTLITFLHYMKHNGISLFWSKNFKGLAIAALVFLIYNTMVIQRVKYDAKDTFVKHTIILDENTRKLWQYILEENDRRYKALSSITPYLRELGIKRTDHVISIPDQSPNITLYMMDQKGCTEFGLFEPDGKDRIMQFIKSGTRYLIINDPIFLNPGYIQPFITNKIGEYKNVQIFELSKAELTGD